MTFPLSASLRVREHLHNRRFEAATADPQRAQERVLTDLLSRNVNTAFGRAQGFASIHTPVEYARQVPIRDYEAFRPYVDRVVGGEEGVLTADPVTMFTTTSGTTAEPKLIPVTDRWRDQMAALNRLWLYRALQTHPTFLHDKVLFIVSPAVEGRTPGGIPYGALSGVTYQRIPRVIRRGYAVPYAVATILDPDVRYFVTMSLALAQSVSAIGTPNATTLLRLAQTAAARGDDIVRAVRDGTVGPVEAHDVDARTLDALSRELRPQPERARLLDSVLTSRGKLLPSACWPHLELIGCWLGGAAGLHAKRLAEHYGDVVLRDLGLLASEGRLTLPVEDASPAGPLTVHTNYFEFVPEDEIDASAPSVLGAHQLDSGARYYIVLTGGNGLYRYDLNDVVEVVGFYRRTPKVAFVRKGRDMVSITGEKIHLNHLHAALAAASAATGASVVEFRFIPEEASLRYDLLVEFHGRPPEHGSLVVFLQAFDQHLSTINREYQSKRSSGRLRPPDLALMRPGWSEEVCRNDFREGRRDVQHKWKALGVQWDETSRTAVIERVALT